MLDILWTVTLIALWGLVGTELLLGGDFAVGYAVLLLGVVVNGARIYRVHLHPHP